ncbi:hypothetical protein F5J12DRAFT_678489, partial [Pisolithus orientalis]|uniref:uncharacterized protein n=1 Tax=Pisolithus orientalis TaxID=936130 RepID=UPI002224DE80
ERQRKDWMVVQKLMENVWPKDDWSTRGKVILGFAVLISANVLNVQAPQLFKHITDVLNMDAGSQSTVWIVAEGATHIGASLFGELLSAVFERSLNLDHKFHLSRRTGGLT